MADINCPSCNGRGRGGAAEFGTAWTCSRCNGRGTLKAFRRIRREARSWIGERRGRELARDLPYVFNEHTSEVIGYVVTVFEDGVNVDHEDGKLWAYYKWSEVPNAEEIKAAIKAATDRIAS